jgi:hypothetical protein
MGDEERTTIRLGSLQAELADEAKALPGKVSFNTYVITLLTTHPDRKKVKARAKKGK